MKIIVLATFFISVAASPKSNSDIFLKCSLTYTTIVPSETSQKVVQHYRVESETGNVWLYDYRINTYQNMCEKNQNVKCEISSNSISYIKNQSDDNGKYYSSFSVNRWNGDFFGYTDVANSEGKATFAMVNKGSCEAGENQIIPEKKF